MKTCWYLVLVGLLLAACADEDGRQAVGELRPVVARGSSLNGTRGLIEDNATPLDLRFARGDAPEADRDLSGGFAGAGVTVTKCTGRRAANGDITFDKQYYDVSHQLKYAYFRGVTAEGMKSTSPAYGYEWTIDGKTDVLVSSLWNAGNHFNPVVATGITFDHALSLLRLKIRTKAGDAQTAVAQAWGEVTSVKVNGLFTTLTYNFQGNLFEASDYSSLRFLKAGCNDAFTTIAIPAGNAATTEGEMLVYPPTSRYLELEVTTTRNGAGIEEETVRQVVITLSSIMQAGKIYTITLSYGTFKDIEASLSSITDWVAGTDDTGGTASKGSILVYGGENGNVTTGLSGSTATSYNSFPAEGTTYYTSADFAYTGEKPYQRLRVATMDGALTDGSEVMAWKTAGGVLQARQACMDYREGGYTDWRLPRLSELKLISLNRSTLESKPGFAPLGTGEYWSGTQYNASYGWCILMGTGTSAAAPNTTGSYRVRCVREIN